MTSWPASGRGCPSPRHHPRPNPNPNHPAPEVTETTPVTPGRSPRQQHDFLGPFVFGVVGYSLATSEYMRQHVRWGLGAGYLWGFDNDFRIALGVAFDHLVDVGFLYDESVRVRRTASSRSQPPARAPRVSNRRVEGRLLGMGADLGRPGHAAP